MTNWSVVNEELGLSIYNFRRFTMRLWHWFQNQSCQILSGKTVSSKPLTFLTVHVVIIGQYPRYTLINRDVKNVFQFKRPYDMFWSQVP